jgi:glucose-6-phosphate-specific signal transduction histidine kinase
MATLQPDSIEGRRFKGAVFPFDALDLLGRAISYLRANYALQSGRLVVWAPVFLSVGIWTYFNLPNEPSLFAIAALAVPIAVLFWFGRHYSIALLIGLVLLGFGLSKVRQEIVATPLLRATLIISAAGSAYW